MGGIAALAGAATNILGLVVFLIFLIPRGYGSKDNPGKFVAFLASNQVGMRISKLS